MLPSSKLLQEDQPELANATTTSRTSPNGPTTHTTITVNDVERNDDDPPPYSAIVPPNHVGWPCNFSGNRYSACNATSCRTDATPLAGFQPGLTSPGFGSHPRRTDGQHASISVPSMPCRLFMFGSRRSLFARESSTDNISIIKDTGRRTRKYGTILVGGAVIIFLMVLSLLVRFIMDKHLWRG